MVVISVSGENLNAKSKLPTSGQLLTLLLTPQMYTDRHTIFIAETVDVFIAC